MTKYPKKSEALNPKRGEIRILDGDAREGFFEMNNRVLIFITSLSLALGSRVSAADWPSIPQKRGVPTAAPLANTQGLPAHDLTVGSAVNPELPGQPVLVFSDTREVTFPINVGINGVFEFSVGHLAGGSYGSLEILIDGVLLGKTRAVGGPVRGIVSTFRTPLLPSHGLELTLRVPQPGSIGVIYFDWENTAFEPVPADVWRRTDKDDGTVELTTHLFRATNWAGLELRLPVDSQATVTINGDAGQRRKTDQGTVQLIYGHKMLSGINQVVAQLPAAEADAFRLAASPEAGRFLAEVPDSFNPELHIDDWPRVELSNGLVEATVALPDPVTGFYRGVRFEHSGMITELNYNGHSFFGINAPEVRNPVGNDHCAGISEEFFEPLGFDEAEPGQPFLKLGVGLLEKPFAKTYFFGTSYWPVKRFDWQWEVGKDRIDLVQQGALHDWAYEYRKRIVLPEGKAALEVHYTLTNTGKRQLTTTQYAHNFIRIDDQPIGKDYTVTFAGKVRHERPLPDSATFTGGNTFTMPDRTMFTPLGGFGSVAENRATVSLPDGTGITISGDFTPFRYWLFASSRVACPEPFIRIDLAPGESMRWRRAYELHGEQRANEN
jgi:hypothetical protein